MRAHLHGLRRAGGGGRHDRRLHSAGGGVGGHRGAAVAGAVLQHLAHALRAQQRQHDAGAAVLEAAGRHEPFALQQCRRAVQRAADQRGAALAHGDRIVHLHRQRRAISPEAARGGVDPSAGEARERRQQQRRAIRSAPARLVQREGLAGPRVKVCERHRGSLRLRWRSGKGTDVRRPGLPRWTVPPVQRLLDAAKLRIMSPPARFPIRGEDGAVMPVSGCGADQGMDMGSSAPIVRNCPTASMNPLVFWPCTL